MAGPSGSQTHHADAAFRKSALVAPDSFGWPKSMVGDLKSE